MKKFLAILAAMMLISTVAFGDELSDSTPVSGGELNTPPLKKLCLTKRFR